MKYTIELTSIQGNLSMPSLRSKQDAQSMNGVWDSSNSHAQMLDRLSSGL